MVQILILINPTPNIDQNLTMFCKPKYADMMLVHKLTQYTLAKS